MKIYSQNLSPVASSGAKWNAVSMLGNLILSMAQISLLTNYLLPEDFGVVALLLVFISILTVFVSVGFSDVLIVKSEATDVQLSTMFWLNIIMGMCVYLILFLVSPLVKNFIDHSDVEIIFQVMGLSILIGSLCVQFRTLMRRNLLFKELAIIDLIAHFCSFVIVIILLRNGYGIWALIISSICTQMVALFFLYYYAFIYKWLPGFIFKIKEVKELIKFGSNRIAASLLGDVYSRVDQLTIGALLGPTALGIYSIAFNFSMQPFLKINPILTQMSFPLFSIIKNDKEKLLSGYRKGLRILMFINSPVLLGMFAVAPLFVPIFLGPGWEDVVLIFQILCLYGLARSAGNINTGLVLSQEKYTWPTYWNLFLLFVIPITILASVQIYESLVFVTYAVMLVQIIILIASYFLFPRRLLGKFGIQFIDDVGRPIIISSIMSFLVILLDKNISFNSQLLELMFLVLFGVVIYVSMSYVCQRRNLKDLVEIILSKG